MENESGKAAILAFCMTCSSYAYTQFSYLWFLLPLFRRYLYALPALYSRRKAKRTLKLENQTGTLKVCLIMLIPRSSIAFGNDLPLFAPLSCSITDTGHDMTKLPLN